MSLRGEMMKRIKLLVLTFGLIFFAGCESSKTEVETVNVDFVGTWNYLITYKNGKCDHLTAVGTIQINPLKDDTSKIGQVMRKGDKFDADKDQQCILSKTEDTNDAFLGYDRMFTKKSYYDYLKKFHRDNRALKSIKITEFAQDKIVVSEKFSGGVVLTFKYHR